MLPAEFEHEMFGQLRVIVTDDQKTMFNLTDVCRALDINNPRQVKSRLAERGVITADTPTRNQFGAMVMQPMTYIDEANLYRCIFQSRKAEAERFQEWVFEEVLPQIRQTGGYIPTKNPQTGETLSANEIVERAFSIMQRTISRENLPAEDCLSMSDVARFFGLEAKELISFLRDKQIIKRVGGRYVMTPRFADLGYDSSRTHHSFSLDGHPKVRSYLVWTPAGKDFVEKVIRGEVEC